MALYHLDFETFSCADLKKYGAYRYAEDASTKILLCAIAEGDSEPVLWSVNGTVEENAPALALLREVSENKDALIYAHNSQFENAISKYNWTKTFSLPVPDVTQWRCTASMARRAAIPSSLSQCASFLGLDELKDASGKKLIRMFSIPASSGKNKGERFMPEDNPEQFEEFGSYCLQDVRTEQKVYKALKKFDLKGDPLEGFLFDAKMNDRGVPVNVEGLLFTDKLVNGLNEKLSVKFEKIVGLRPTQTIKFVEWLQSKGYPGKNLQVATVSGVLGTDPKAIGMEPIAYEALKIRSLLGFAALKKIPTMLSAANSDGHVRGALMWSGAERTHRWAGRIIQPQNFKRPEIKDTENFYSTLCSGALELDTLEMLYDNPLLAIASCIRHFIQPKGERGFFDADYASIEARIVCWLCDQEDSLDLFRANKDIYKVMSSHIFGIEPEEVTKEQRFVGKQAVLGCGFGMGEDKFKGTCEAYGQNVSTDLASRAIKTFRKVNNRVSASWKSINEAAKAAIKAPGTKFNGTDKVVFCYGNECGFPALIMRVPSGHCLIYPRARLDIVEKTFKGDTYKSQEIVFWGKVPGKSNMWGWVSTYGGKLLENATQAVAGDVMSNGAVKAQAKGYEIFMLVHDQALAKIKPGQSIEEFCDILCDLPEWADGLPIEAEGSEVPFYRKD